MIQHSLPDFLSDDAAYAKAERFWVDLWARIVREAGEENQWHSPWLNSTCVDGTRMRDGDPIFSAIRDDGSCAVRIVQFPPRKLEGEFWTNVRAFDPEGENIQLLEVFCSLPEKNEGEASTTLARWVKDGTPREATGENPS